MEDFIASLDPWLVYVVIAVLTLGESAAFLSLVLPGEIALIAAAALGLSAGLDPVLLAGVAALGASLGGILGYSIGKRFGRRLIEWEPIDRRFGRRMNELRPLLAGSEAGALVAVARFNQITRAIVPALAGMAGMGRFRFAAANAVGALIWAAAFTAIGYYAAEWWRSTSGLVHLVIGVLAIAGVGGWIFVRRRPEAPGPASADEPGPEV